MTIKIWDTAGQERFRTITTNFYRRADGVIVAFDIIDKGSFDGVHTWMKSCSDHCDGSADIVICGNKNDLVEKRVVSEAECQQLAESYNVRYFDTIAIKNEGLTEMMEYLIEKVYDRKFAGKPSES